MKISKTLPMFLATMLLGISFPMQHSKAAPHPAGTNVSKGGTIYMITDNGQRRPYTSAGAFLSYGFNSWAAVAEASAADMALPEGAFIPPRDGKIVCSDRGSDKGTCYLITSGKRAAFVSAKVFTKLGFSFAKTVAGDVSFLEKDTDISNASAQHRPGVLIKKSGTIYLVGADGLLGIPGVDILKSWGYSLKDAVAANESDLRMPQASVIAHRQGAQLMPGGPPPAAADIPANTVSDSSLIQGYIDTYPDLPAATVSAPEDAAQVIELVKKIEAIPGSSFDPVYPYLASQSYEMFNKIPSIKKYFESPTPGVSLASMNPWNTNIQVYEGITYALYTVTKKQTETGYENNDYWVCKKENGVWKWDFLGSLKYQSKISKQYNPSRAYTSGAGSSDLGITYAEYTSNPAINDPNTLLVLGLKNYGQTIIKKFDILVRFDNIIIINQTASYEIQPNQDVFFVMPIDHYWLLDSAAKNPGQFTTEIKIGFDAATADNNSANNTSSFSAIFQQKPAPVINNLVGN